MLPLNVGILYIYPSSNRNLFATPSRFTDWHHCCLIRIMKIFKSIFLAIAPLVFLAPTIALANVTLTLGNMQFANPTTVHIANSSPAVTEYVYSGALSATASDTAQSFEAWCVDIFQNAYFNWSSSDYVSESASIYPGTDKSNLLLKLATESLGSVNNSLTSSAFQLAVWEIVNETSGSYSLSDGTFSASGASDDSIALANNWLSKLPGVTTHNSYSISVLHSADYQDFAVFTAVPEPGTIALFGLGLLGIATSRRKSGKRDDT